MWVGTIFAHDKDNDGTINYDKPEEYNLEFDVKCRTVGCCKWWCCTDSGGA